MDDLAFSTLLCSRLCHDLISPVGAISNGIEILEDETDPQMRDHALSLIRMSATQSSAKLKFFRVTFGASSSLGGELSLADMHNLCLGLVESGNTEIDWKARDISLPRDVVRLLLNFVLIGLETLPRGGVLRVGAKREGAINLMVSAEGSKALLSERAVNILRNGAEVGDIEPRESNVLLTHRIAKSFGAPVLCLIEEGMVQIAATL